MLTMITKRSFAVAAVAAIGAGLGILWSVGELQAQEEEAGLVIGTYQPQQVAQSSGLQEQMMQQMQGLQQRMAQAQQTGDQQAMQQIQAEAQQIQQDLQTQFMDAIDATMAPVAKETGVQVIAVQVDYTAPGVETTDVTENIIDNIDFEGSGAAATDGSE